MMQADEAAAIFASIKKKAPRVHCLTNGVAQNFTANMLLAVGAIPSMTFAENEVADFVSKSDALLINMGMMTPQSRPAFEKAILAAETNNRPWLLDPVFVDRSPERRHYAQYLLSHFTPDLVKMNKGEVAMFANHHNINTENEETCIKALAHSYKTTMICTGKKDIISNGKQICQISYGSPLMQAVTAMGCALGAIIVAASTVEKNYFKATEATLIIAGISGEIAAKQSAGPGSFAPNFLDALYNISPQILKKHME